MGDRTKKGKAQKNFRKATKEEKAYTKRTIKGIRGKTPKKPAADKEGREDKLTLLENKHAAQNASAGPHVTTVGKDNFEPSRAYSQSKEGLADNGRSRSQGKPATRAEKKNIDFLQNTRKGQHLQKVEARHARRDVRKGKANPTQLRHQTGPNEGGARLHGDQPVMSVNHNSIGMRNKSIDILNKKK